MQLSRGAVLAEAAITLPILLMVVGALIDFSLISAQQSAVLTAFQEASRRTAIESSVCQSPGEISLTMKNAYRAAISRAGGHPHGDVVARIVRAPAEPPRLESSLVAPVPCLFCQFFSAFSGEPISYTARSSLLLEKREVCW